MQGLEFHPWGVGEMKDKVMFIFKKYLVKKNSSGVSHSIDLTTIKCQMPDTFPALECKFMLYDILPNLIYSGEKKSALENKIGNNH